jgi:hypothetical protein
MNLDTRERKTFEAASKALKTAAGLKWAVGLGNNDTALVSVQNEEDVKRAKFILSKWKVNLTKVEFFVLPSMGVVVR